MSALTSAASTDSLLGRRNPTVKLAVTALVSVILLFVLDPLTPAALYLLALIGVAVSARMAPRVLALAHLPFLAFALGLLLVNALSRPGLELWQAGPLRVTSQGLEVGAALAGRTLVIGVLAIGFLRSTDPVDLMTSLHQNARLSSRVTYAVLAGYRMLQEMPREWTTIQHAHAVRAPTREDHRLPRGARHLAGVVFTLLVVSIRKGERLAQSLESRGLGLQPRTTWRPVPVRRSDWVFALVVLAAVAVVLTGSAALGVLRGPGALG